MQCSVVSLGRWLAIFTFLRDYGCVPASSYVQEQTRWTKLKQRLNPFNLFRFLDEHSEFGGIARQDQTRSICFDYIKGQTKQQNSRKKLRDLQQIPLLWGVS